MVGYLAPIAQVLMAIGLALAAGAHLTFAITGGNGPIVLIIGAFAALSVGIGMAETLSNDIIVASVPPAKAGAASAVSETAYELGAVLGTSVLGGILAASYAANLVLPQGLTPAQGSEASQTLAGALTVAEALPEPVGESLIESARHAFDSGIVMTSSVGALLMAGAVVLALRTVRGQRA